MSKLRNYFDLTSAARSGLEAQQQDAETGQSIHWLPQYIAILLGIAAQPFFQRYMSTGVWDLKGLGGWLAASAIISIMGFPAVYKKTFDVEKPLFVQLCVIFTAGTGWQTLVSTSLKAAGIGASN